MRKGAPFSSTARASACGVHSRVARSPSYISSAFLLSDSYSCRAAK